MGRADHAGGHIVIIVWFAAVVLLTLGVGILLWVPCAWCWIGVPLSLLGLLGVGLVLGHRAGE